MNIDRGTPVYMAPELFSADTASLSFKQLKMCDIWTFGMVLFILLNPDLQYPYQLEIIKLHHKTYENTKKEVIDRFRLQQIQSTSSKYQGEIGMHF